MRGILVIALGAGIIGTIFFVSLIELLFTLRRRKVHAQLEERLKQVKVSYNEGVNKIVMESEAKVDSTEEQLKKASEQLQSTEAEAKAKFEAELEKVKTQSDKQIDAAKAKAKKFEAEAKEKAEAYYATRQKEVERDLMNLVISVTKKVLPQGLTYEVQKDLVLEALRNVKSEHKQ